MLKYPTRHFGNARKKGSDALPLPVGYTGEGYPPPPNDVSPDVPTLRTVRLQIKESFQFLDLALFDATLVIARAGRIEVVFRMGHHVPAAFAVNADFRRLSPGTCWSARTTHIRPAGQRATSRRRSL